MKNRNLSFKPAQVLVIALLVGRLLGSVFAAMAVPGLALTVTVVGMSEGDGQTDTHVRGNWVA